MARKPRIEFSGALYHVIARGNQRQRIFRGTEDFQRYEKILAHYKGRHEFFLYAYVLMDNHVHLLIETREIPLSKIIQGINQSYTVYFNRKYQTVGHLFQGRYKAILCDKEAYLLSLVKYIHLNPLRGGFRRWEGYRWSSHGFYEGKSGKKGMVDVDQALGILSENKARAQRLYRSLIRDGVPVKKEDIYSTVEQRILGDEGFVRAIKETHRVELREERRKKAYGLRKIGSAIERMTGMGEEQLRGRSKDRGASNARKLFSLVAREYGYGGLEIARYIGRDASLISRFSMESSDFREEINSVIKTLEKSKCQ